MRFKWLVFLAAAASAATGSVAADGPSPAILAASCASCHGPAGRSPGDIPPLAEMEADGIVELMKGYKTGAIEATVMGRIARGFTDDEIVALADFIANLNP